MVFVHVIREICPYEPRRLYSIISSPQPIENQDCWHRLHLSSDTDERFSQISADLWWDQVCLLDRDGHSVSTGLTCYCCWIYRPEEPLQIFSNPKYSDAEGQRFHIAYYLMSSPLGVEPSSSSLFLLLFHPPTLLLQILPRSLSKPWPPQSSPSISLCLVIAHQFLLFNRFLAFLLTISFHCTRDLPTILFPPECVLPILTLKISLLPSDDMVRSFQSFQAYICW